MRKCKGDVTMAMDYHKTVEVVTPIIEQLSMLIHDLDKLVDNNNETEWDMFCNLIEANDSLITIKDDSQTILQKGK